MKVLTIAVLLLTTAPVARAQISAADAKRRMDELNARAAAQQTGAAGFDHATTQATSSTQPAPPAAQPGRSPAELQAAAFTFLRAGQYIKAGPLLDQAYKLTPPADVRRPLVLDRAIVDIALVSNAPRAVKDLTGYVSTNPMDEMAVDMLGAAGRKSMDHNQHFENTALARDGERVLASAISTLESVRPGYRKWGAQWMKKSEFFSIESRQHHAQFECDVAQRSVQDAQRRLDEAKASAQSQNTISTAGGTRGTGISRVWVGDTIAQRQQDAQRRQSDAQSTVARAQADYDAAVARLDSARREFPQPDWPVDFQPVDPDAPTTMPADEFDPDFKAAIAAHQLVVGMTLAQAQAAMGPGTLVRDDGSRQEFRWIAPADPQSAGSGAHPARPGTLARPYFTVMVEGGVIVSFHRHDL